MCFACLCGCLERAQFHCVFALEIVSFLPRHRLPFVVVAIVVAVVFQTILSTLVSIENNCDKRKWLLIVADAMRHKKMLTLMVMVLPQWIYTLTENLVSLCVCVGVPGDIYPMQNERKGGREIA